MKKIKNYITGLIYGNKLTAVLRIIIGLLFIYSGFFKALDLESFGSVILLYDVTPALLAPYGAIIIPFLELVLGILLLAGYRIKSASLISGMLMFVWTVLIAVSMYRGKSFDCGCFELSRFGFTEEIGPSPLIRDIVLFGILFIIYNARQHFFSIDKKIEERNLKKL